MRANFTTYRHAVRRRRFFVPSKVASGTVAITTPAQYKVFQRSGSTGSISITGTYTGSPAAIEASFNGGAYVTIANGSGTGTMTGGNYSGTLSSQTNGQGTLTVRFTDDNAVTATKTYIGIGDVFLVVGDSHYEGRATSAQSYTHATLRPSVFRQDDAWALCNDPVDIGTSNGSHWPAVADLIMTDQSVPVAFITCATGGTDLYGPGTANTWASGNADYVEMQAQYTAAATNGIKGVLGSFGGNAMGVDSPSQANYNTAVDSFVDAVNAYNGATTMINIFGDASTYPRADLDNVRLAIKEAWGNNSNCKPGCMLFDQSYSDDVHAATNGEIAIFARRLYCAIKEQFYGASSGYGRGPRVSSMTLDSSKLFITITFDRDLASGTTYGGFRVLDSGTPATIVAATRASSRRVVIEVSSALSDVGNVRVSFGSGGDAAGATVPTSTAITLPDANTITLPAELFIDVAVSAEGSGTSLTGGVFSSPVIRASS